MRAIVHPLSGAVTMGGWCYCPIQHPDGKFYMHRLYMQSLERARQDSDDDTYEIDMDAKFPSAKLALEAVRNIRAALDERPLEPFPFVPFQRTQWCEIAGVSHKNWMTVLTEKHRLGKDKVWRYST